jgi:hypothetical protein
MLTVGGGLVKLDGFSAFVAVLSEAITVHIYAIIGVPVSTFSSNCWRSTRNRDCSGNTINQ